MFGEGENARAEGQAGLPVPSCGSPPGREEEEETERLQERGQGTPSQHVS